MNPKDKEVAPSKVGGTETNEETAPDPDVPVAEPEEDKTCCKYAICCLPVIRNTNISNPLSPCCHIFTWSTVFWLITNTLMILMFWAICYFLFGDTFAPGGALFGFGLVCVSSYFLGWSLTYIPYIHLPPVFGMLVAGIIIRNVGLYNIHEGLGYKPTALIRAFCMTFIMLRAGLQLMISPLRHHPLFIIMLSFIPCTIEMAVVGLCCKFILEYPWLWAFLTGTIIACLSPVVTVNCMLALADRGYGEDKGISTLLCTAASVDDVHIVAIFAIFYSFVFSVDNDDKEKSWWMYIPGGIRDLILGLTAGITLGFIFVFFPHRNHRHALRYRVINLVFGSIMCTSAAPTLAITGGGFLATVIVALISTTGWRCISDKFDVKPLRTVAGLMWHLMQPVLLGVIGADIDLQNWDAKRFGLHVACIIIGLLTRGLFAALSTINMPFTTSERVFVAIAWLPKGTVQAALAPMAYEQAIKQGDEEEMKIAEDVLKISIVAIIFLAPLGAITMMVTGPWLLNKISDEDLKERQDRSDENIVRLQPVPRKRLSRTVNEGEPPRTNA